MQDWLSADDGDQPDAMYCLLAVQCLEIWAVVKAAGYEGTFQTSLFSDLLIEPLAGTVASAFYNIEPNDGLTQMQEDLEAFEPGTEVSATNAYAYFAADMFIQALKKVGTNVTPEAVQEALANQTWEIEGFAGPTRYPESTVAVDAGLQRAGRERRDGVDGGRALQLLGQEAPGRLGDGSGHGWTARTLDE